MTNDKNIYKLQLHEATTTPNVSNDYSLRYIVTRVPGGWIYEPTCDHSAAVFVPYSEDMKDPMDGVAT